MISRKVNYSDYGIPQTGWYRVEDGIQHFNSSNGSSQAKNICSDNVIHEYKKYNRRPCDALYLTQPKNGVRGEFEVVETISGLSGKKNNTLLKGIMNEHGDVVQITKNNQFLEEMVTNGKTYPNSIRRVAKKCLEHFRGRI